MYAVVDIAGIQYKISEKEKLIVPRLDVKVGDKLDLDRVLMVSSDDGVKIGQPLLEKAKVEASVLNHDRSKKVVVFKKKRRKDYKVTKGHRQPYTQIQIDKITL
jgi:large subunit ribosomal protein L21